MILAGAWLIILGYGIAYGGVFKLANQGKQVQCSLRDVFTGQCTAGGGNAQTSYQPPAPQQAAASLPSTVLA